MEILMELWGYVVQAGDWVMAERWHLALVGGAEAFIWGCAIWLIWHDAVERRAQDLRDAWEGSRLGVEAQIAAEPPKVPEDWEIRCGIDLDSSKVSKSIARIKDSMMRVPPRGFHETGRSHVPQRPWFKPAAHLTRGLQRLGRVCRETERNLGEFGQALNKTKMARGELTPGLVLFARKMAEAGFGVEFERDIQPKVRSIFDLPSLFRDLEDCGLKRIRFSTKDRQKMMIIDFCSVEDLAEYAERIHKLQAASGASLEQTVEAWLAYEMRHRDPPLGEDWFGGLIVERMPAPAGGIRIRCAPYAFREWGLTPDSGGTPAPAHGGHCGPCDAQKTVAEGEQLAILRPQEPLDVIMTNTLISGLPMSMPRMSHEGPIVKTYGVLPKCRTIGCGRPAVMEDRTCVLHEYPKVVIHCMEPECDREAGKDSNYCRDHQDPQATIDTDWKT